MLSGSPVSFANPHLINPLGNLEPIYIEKRKIAGQGGAKPNRARGKTRQMTRNNEGTKVLHAEELRSQPAIRSEEKGYEW